MADVIEAAVKAAAITACRKAEQNARERQAMHMREIEHHGVKSNVSTPESELARRDAEMWARIAHDIEEGVL